MPRKPKEITQDRASLLRLQNQGLVQPFKRPSAIMKRLIALPAADPGSARQSLLARCHKSAFGAIHRTLNSPSRIIKSSVIRNIPQYILADDLDMLRNALGDFHLVSTSDYLMTTLTKNGYAFHPDLRREPRNHRLDLLRYLKGVSNEHYRQRLALLFLRYITAFGPASVSDFAHWAGLPSASCRRVQNHFGTGVRHVKICGLKDSFYVPRRIRYVEEPTRSVHLLPSTDPFLSAYRPRNFLLQGGRPGRRAVILLDGESVATWKMHRSLRRICFSVRPFREMAVCEISATEEKFRSLAAFLSSPQYDIQFLKPRTKGDT